MNLYPQSRKCSLNLESDQSPSGFRLFLTLGDDPIPTTSQLAPDFMRSFVRGYRSSANPASDLADFLGAHPETSVRVHLPDRVVEVQWVKDSYLTAKTSMAINGEMVYLSRACFLGSSDVSLESFSMLGDFLVLDLNAGRMWKLNDRSGWFLADSAINEYRANTEGSDEFAVEYDDSEVRNSLSDEGDSIQVAPDAYSGSDSVRGFIPGSTDFSAPLELSLGQFNLLRLSIPSEMRDSYLKDVCFFHKNLLTVPVQAEVDSGLSITLSKTQDEINLKVISAWNNHSFTDQDRFLQYFEYLDNHHNAEMRKKRSKRLLREAALEILDLQHAEELEPTIADCVAALKTDQADTQRDAAEYLRRFYNNFFIHRKEIIFATAYGWKLIEVQFRNVGRVLSAVNTVLNVSQDTWLSKGSIAMKIPEFFSIAPKLMTILEYAKIDIFHDAQKASKADLSMKFNIQPSAGIDWLQITPQIQINGSEVDLTEIEDSGLESGFFFHKEKTVILNDAERQALNLVVKKLKEEKRTNPNEISVRRFSLFDWLHLKRFGADFKLPAKEQALFDALLDLKRIPNIKPPTAFRGQLRDYQGEGYSWITFLYNHRLGGCLADDMGLGKTVQAIAFIAKRNELISDAEKRPGPVMVVSPSTLIFNWLNEFSKFAPDLNVFEATSKSVKQVKSNDILVASYDYVRKNVSKLRDLKLDVVIFDEAQYLKNENSKRSLSAKLLNANFFLTITGTPLENHIGEYKTVLGVSVPGLFSDRKSSAKIINPFDREIIVRRSTPFVLRRTKEAILKDLPPKIESEVYLDSDASQKKLYRQIAIDARRNVRNIFKKQGDGKAVMTALTAILRLRQLCISPELLGYKMQGLAPKISYLNETMKNLISENHSALVFSQFTSALDLIEKSFLEQGFCVYRLDGKVTISKRKSIVESFQSNQEPAIFLISLKAGGFGLNLTRASYVYHVDPWWNPAVENQATDRTHRIGQSKSVNVFRLIMRGTIEEKLMELKSIKQQDADSVLSGMKDEVFDGKLSRGDFEFLLGGN